MIGGIEDHVHMYLRWRPDGAVSDLMRTVKSQDFKSELLRVLRENNVKFDERYVFD